MKYRKASVLLLSCTTLAWVNFYSVGLAVAAAMPTVNSSLANQEMIFNAVDSGDVDRLRRHFDFIKTFRTINPNVVSNDELHLNFRDQQGNTPLIRAARKNNIDTIRILLNNGADINAVNNNKESALTTSYTYENYHVSHYLLSLGAADSYSIAQLLPDSRPQVNSLDASGADGAYPPLEQKAWIDRGYNLELVIGGVVAAGAAGGIVAATAGGGSSQAPVTVTAPTPPSDAYLNPVNLNPATFVTPEALGQQGIVGMNTQYALARGYDGRIYNRNPDGTLVSTTSTGFVKVAVVDNGVDLTHPDLVNNILAANSVTCGDSGCVPGGQASVNGDENFHGTAVAGIIAAQKNGVGIYGIASQAKIISVGFADPVTGDLTFGDTPGIESALSSGAQVLNGSYGVSNLTPPTASPAQIRAQVGTTTGGTTSEIQYQRGVQNHAIFVYAAGNESLANPDIPAGLPYYFQGVTAPAGITQANYDVANPYHLDWSKNWVAVVSLNNSKSISSFSNKCGVAMNWCIAAPGEITTSTNVGGGYTGAIEGTSFAAPNVTGAIAVLLGAFPQLTPEKALQILFNTATDLGTPGVDAIYGHGLVNLEKATSPSDGGWSLTSVSGKSFAYNVSGLGLSTPFGNALKSSTASLQFLDAYGKNYTIPLSSVTKNLTLVRTDFDKMNKLAGPAPDNILRLDENSSMSFSNATTPNNMPGTPQTKLSKFSYASVLPADKNSDSSIGFTFNYNTNLADSVASPDQRTIASDALTNPYVALVDVVNSSVMEYSQGQSTVKMAAYFGKYNHDNDYQYAFNTSKNISGVFSEITYLAPDSKSHLSFDNGVNIENNSLLGSEASGAFAVDKALTYYTGVSGKYQLSDDVALIANYNMGMTQVSASGASIITGFNTIMTNAFGAGSEVYNIADAKDTLGFIVSQPLRVTSGRAALALPVGVSSGGNTFYENNNLSLTPTGRELDFESYYKLKNDDDSDFGLDLMFRLEPNNAYGNNDATLLATYKMKFGADMLSF